MKMMGRVAVKIIGCALLLLAVAAYQPALADCTASVFFGNITGLTTVRIDLTDPSATWATYMLQDPTINQGPVLVGQVAVDLGEFGGEPGTAFVFQDWAAGLGMIGCPLTLNAVPADLVIDNDPANEVFVFSDSKNGATIVIVQSADGNQFNFDTTSATGGELARAVMKPRVLRASTSAACVDVELSWDAAVINQDALSAAVAANLLRGYRIFETRTGSGAGTGEVADSDGSTTDTHALVCLAKGTNATDTSTLTVGADLAGGTGIGATAHGAASSPIMNSGLAVPGRGKGLLKAPGQLKK